MTHQLRIYHERLEQALASVLSSLQTIDQEIESDPNISTDACQLQEHIGRALSRNEQILRVLNEYLEVQN